jgi:hypothetical protein
MTKTNTNMNPHISGRKKVAVVVGSFVSLFGGMLAAIVAIENFKNYNSPYLFGFVFGSIGLIIGILVASKLKSKIIISSAMRRDYSLFTILISTGFIGLSVLLAQITNSNFSNEERCDNFKVVEKFVTKGGYKRIESNILVIEIDDELHRLITNPSSWQNVTVGEKVNLCLYKGILGFEFVK